MSVETELSSLSSLVWYSYIDSSGLLPAHLAGAVGVYAIFDADKVLQYVGYSRDIALSLKLHLVRQPHYCYWLKVQTVQRPSRTILETLRNHWIAENGTIPPGNAAEPSLWEHPIDVKSAMTAAEKSRYGDPGIDERTRTKVLKQVARRIEAERLDELSARNWQEPLRFNPKLKDEGFLDLKT
jgi:hypothetical protein